MIDVAGPYLLILLTSRGLAVQEMESRVACEAAVIQIEAVPFEGLAGICIAATVKEDTE